MLTLLIFLFSLLGFTFAGYAHSEGTPPTSWGTEFGHEPEFTAELKLMRSLEKQLWDAWSQAMEEPIYLADHVTGKTSPFPQQGHHPRPYGFGVGPMALPPVAVSNTGALKPGFSPALSSRIYSPPLGTQEGDLIRKGVKPVEFDLPVAINPRVLYYIQFFVGRGRHVYARWYARMGRYQPMISQILAEEGLPQDLVYLAMIESGFSPRALSRARACGLWQFIESSGRDYGLHVDYWIDERQDPVKATRAAATYLKYLHNRFGSWELAMVAYNTGQGRLLRAIKRYNSNDYWELSKYRSLPREARFYVPKVIGAALIGKNPEVFGFDVVVKESPFVFDEVVVPAGTELEIVAKACSLPLDVISDLNPELRRNVVPPYIPDYRVRIPRGSREQFDKTFEKLQVSARKDYLKHQVRFGETLRSIARAHGITVNAIRSVNRLPAPHEPTEGQVVIVPVPQGKKSRPTAEAEETTVVIPQINFSYPNKTRAFFEVPHGYDIGQIAEFFDVCIYDLAMWNALDPRANLHSGMVLQLYLPNDFNFDAAVLLRTSRIRTVQVDSEEFDDTAQAVRRRRTSRRKPDKPKEPPFITHTVKKGEFLGRIAQRHGVTVQEIIRHNRGLRADRLQIGQRLRIPNRRARR